MSESAHADLRVMKDLLDIMSRLRDPNDGCPWDLRQDFESIVPFTIEETYELAEAIALGDYDQVRDELGDVLFQVIFMRKSRARDNSSTLRMLQRASREN